MSERKKKREEEKKQKIFNERKESETWEMLAELTKYVNSGKEKNNLVSLAQNVRDFVQDGYATYDQVKEILKNDLEKTWGKDKFSDANEFVESVIKEAQNLGPRIKPFSF